MKIKLVLPATMLSFILLPVSVTQADPICDSEVKAIQSLLDSPTSSINASDLEQARILFDLMSENCTNGSALEDVMPTSQQIRVLLGMEDAS